MRYVLTAIGVVLLLVSLGGMKAAQIGKLVSYGKKAQSAGPPPETVASAISQAQDWETTLSSIGTVASGKGVAISNDMPGLITRISFESGAVVKQGQVLVELDTTVERAQLASAVARSQLASQTAGRTRKLEAAGAISAQQADVDESQLRASQTDVAGLQAIIGRKVIRAPFAGRLGIRQVNIGQYLAPGTPITVLESVEAVHVDFTLPQQLFGQVAAGMPMRLELEDKSIPPIEGKVGAVAPSIDPATRNVKLRGDLEKDDDRLHNGMFVKVTVVLPEKKKVIVVPATAVIHAPYGDSVFVVEDTPEKKKVARQHFVRLGESRGDFIAISTGLDANTRVVTAGAFKLRNGAPITIDDAKQPPPSLDPKPENR